MISLGKLRCLQLVGVFLVLTLCSCATDQTNNEVTKHIGKQLLFPTSLQAQISGQDTTCVIDTIYPKVVSYYNLEGCTPCRMKELLDWVWVSNELDTASNVKAYFIFAFDPKGENNPDFELRNYRFDKCVIFTDPNKEFEQLNSLSDNYSLRTFLVDKNNKIALVGTPVNNPVMFDLYRITGKNLYKKNK